MGEKDVPEDIAKIVEQARSEGMDPLLLNLSDMKDGMEKSEFFLCIVPDKPDSKVMFEIGMAVLLDKPFVLVSFGGRPITDNLRKLAIEIIEVNESSKESAKFVAEQLARFLKEQHVSES